ncbi:hypothetical protein DL96DRAFT_912595 [Flagelloscypha sp. PMI_526]|nr:hypothetical protein DL96DRAFT_912595 [Flagelloscypha sp. PMI_526]
MNPLNAHSLPSTSFISQQHRPTTTLNHTPIPRPLNFEAASNRWVLPSTSRRTIPRPLLNSTGEGHVPIAAALPSPSLVIPPPKPSAATSYPKSKTESASFPLARKRPLPSLPSSAEDALTSAKPTLARLPISPSEPRKQRHDIFASAVPPPRRGRLPDGESLLALSPISPTSDPDSVLQHELWERATLVNEQAGSLPLEFDLATLDDDPLVDHEDEDKDDSSSVRSLSPIRHARPLRQEDEAGTSSSIWEQILTEWDDRISPFPQMDSDQSEDESDSVTEVGGGRSVSSDSHVQRPGRQRVGSDDNKASSATPRKKESAATRHGLRQTEMP